MRIISARGRAVIAKKERQRRLEEQFQIQQLPLSDEEKHAVERVFENIRRQLDAIGRGGAHA